MTIKCLWDILRMDDHFRIKNIPHLDKSTAALKYSLLRIHLLLGILKDLG